MLAKPVPQPFSGLRPRTDSETVRTYGEREEEWSPRPATQMRMFGFSSRLEPTSEALRHPGIHNAYAHCELRISYRGASGTLRRSQE